MIVAGVCDIHLSGKERRRPNFTSKDAKPHQMVVTNDYREVIQSDSVEVVVDATGVLEVGANISLEALN
ncbi:hypothetical protein ACEQPO_12390 [Bacillus sp. SL00103]